MRLIINSNLDFEVLQGQSRQIDFAKGKVFLFGDLSGLYQNDVCLDKDRALEIVLQHCFGEERLREILLETIGHFVICIASAKEISFFVSPAGPGFFFCQEQGKWRIFSEEKELFMSLQKSEVNDFEVLRTLSLHPQFRNPFASIFNKGKRVIGGGYLKIRKNNEQAESGLYLPLNKFCSEARSFAGLAYEFKNRFETTLENVFTANKRENNYILVSGGIDSSAILLASQKKNLPVLASHWRRAPVLTEAVQYLCSHLGVELMVFGNYLEDINSNDWWATYLENSKNYFKSGLGILGIDSIFLGSLLVREKGLYVFGDSVEHLYQCEPFRFADFTRSPFKHWLKDTLQKKPKRFTNTERFWQMKGMLKPWVARLASSNFTMPKNDFEYLLGAALNFKFPLMPKNILPFKLKNIENDYKNYIAQSFVKPLLGNELFEQAQKGYNFSSREISQYLRMLFVSTMVQGAALNNYNYQKAGGFALANPFMEGPMVKLFCSLPITMREVLHPKGLLFEYFKTAASWDYYRGFLKEFTNVSFFIEAQEKIRKMLQRKKRKEDELEEREAILTSRIFKEHFLCEINPANSAVLPLLHNPIIKDYLYNLYQQIQHGENRSFIVINQILNLELFLKNL